MVLILPGRCPTPQLPDAVPAHEATCPAVRNTLIVGAGLGADDVNDRQAVGGGVCRPGCRGW